MYPKKAIDSAYQKAEELWERRIQWIIGCFYDDVITEKELYENKEIGSFMEMHEITAQAKKELEDALIKDMHKKYALVSSVMDSRDPHIFWIVRFEESQESEIVTTTTFSGLIKKLKHLTDIEFDGVIKASSSTHTNIDKMDKELWVSTYTISFQLVSEGLVLVIKSYEKPALFQPLLISKNKEQIISLIDRVGVDWVFSKRFLVQKWSDDDMSDPDSWMAMEPV